MSYHELDPSIRTIAERELTTRQLDVLKLHLANMSTRRISLALDISEPRARQILERSLQKLAIHLRPQEPT